MATDVWQLDTAEAIELRRAGRHTVVVSRATVRGQGQSAADATLLDVSVYGCRIAALGEHAAGDRLWLRLDGGWPIPATVVWADGERMGCRFDQPIAGSTMRDLTRD
ncbi:PilZ domain-containing protein [Sphingomonas sp.]|uniref:PilZ domain-containing protein n=1 Tax=Sphingomonas sp. TaxID=28214 RepID=UPI002D7FA422|nr:PilZ domain-containing protein [Sphingomonas sp.]HEU0044339.1 PilZ domain-containing protein [Sphingomonas sp.]